MFCTYLAIKPEELSIAFSSLNFSPSFRHSHRWKSFIVSLVFRQQSLYLRFLNKSILTLLMNLIINFWKYQTPHFLCYSSRIKNVLSVVCNIYIYSISFLIGKFLDSHYNENRTKLSTLLYINGSLVILYSSFFLIKMAGFTLNNCFWNVSDCKWTRLYQ